MPQWGVGAAGFVAKPYASILADIQSAQLATMNPAIDLSPSGPLGQQNGIMALTFAQLWQLAQTVYNGFNRQAAEGAALDNLGALTGSPREGGTYTQVLVTLTFTGAAIGKTFIPGCAHRKRVGNTVVCVSERRRGGRRIERDRRGYAIARHRADCHRESRDAYGNNESRHRLDEHH